MVKSTSYPISCKQLLSLIKDESSASIEYNENRNRLLSYLQKNTNKITSEEKKLIDLHVNLFLKMSVDESMHFLHNSKIANDQGCFTKKWFIDQAKQTELASDIKSLLK